MEEINVVAMKNMTVLCEARKMLLQGLVVIEGGGMSPETAQVLEDVFAYAMKKCAESIEFKDQADA